MSYDLFLFRPQPGRGNLDVAREMLEAAAESDEINSGAVSGEKERRKEALADAILASVPLLKRYEFRFQEIAETLGITADEARVAYRHIELNEDSTGTQIVLYDDTAELTVPYWHAAEKAVVVWEYLWICLSDLQDQGGFVIYDPQLDKIVSLQTDLAQVTSRYLDVIKQLSSVTLEDVSGGVGDELRFGFDLKKVLDSL